MMHRKHGPITFYNPKQAVRTKPQSDEEKGKSVIFLLSWLSVHSHCAQVIPEHIDKWGR